MKITHQNTHQITHHLIVSRSLGKSFGIWQGETPEASLREMHDCADRWAEPDVSRWVFFPLSDVTDDRGSWERSGILPGRRRLVENGSDYRIEPMEPIEPVE